MTRPIAIAPGARAYRAVRGIAYALPGTIIIDEASGIRLRVLETGAVEEVGEVPRRWSASADPCASRRAA